MSRVVIRFALSSEIPKNADIKKAVCSIFFTGVTIGNKYTTSYRLTKEWDESEVTWMNATSDVPWITPGGDYSEVNTSKIDYVPDSSWENYDVTNIVRQFTSGTPNYGFLIASDRANGNKHRSYYSSEFTKVDSLRPKLTIIHTSTAINTFTQHKNLLRKSILLCKKGSVIKLFVPFEKHYRLSLFNPGGKVIETIYGSNSRWYQLKATIPSNGIYFMQIHIDGKTASWKVILMK